MAPTHLLALARRNGIGCLGCRLPGALDVAAPRVMTKEELLRTRYTPDVFGELVAPYLSTGAGIAGMQPKIMVPDRLTVPVPLLIVKAASPSHPGLAANEFPCLCAARRAGIQAPEFSLSDEGQEQSLRGVQFGELQESLQAVDDVVVDIGASNVEELMRLMHRYRESHEEFIPGAVHYPAPYVRLSKLHCGARAGLAQLVEQPP